MSVCIVPVMLPSKEGVNLVPSNLRTWFTEAPVGSISIESTVSVVD